MEQTQKQNEMARIIAAHMPCMVELNKKENWGYVIGVNWGEQFVELVEIPADIKHEITGEELFDRVDIKDLGRLVIRTLTSATQDEIAALLFACSKPYFIEEEGGPTWDDIMGDLSIDEFIHGDHSVRLSHTWGCFIGTFEVFYNGVIRLLDENDEVVYGSINERAFTDHARCIGFDMGFGEILSLIENGSAFDPTEIK